MVRFIHYIALLAKGRKERSLVVVNILLPTSHPILVIYIL